jgi:Family of unknown function (DUF6361)
MSLGLGTIRDAFADMLFPGTSAPRIRPRYFLIVPWIYLRPRAAANCAHLGTVEKNLGRFSRSSERSSDRRKSDEQEDLDVFKLAHQLALKTYLPRGDSQSYVRPQRMKMAVDREKGRDTDARETTLCLTR